MVAKVPPPVAAQPPSDSEMKAVLGEAYDAFQALVMRAGPGAAEWRRYSKNSPWVLKVSQGKRSLFYARPDSGHLKVTVLLGGRAVEAALAGRVSKRLHESIRKARAYPEGRPVSVAIKRPSDLGKVEELIAAKVAATARPVKGTLPRGRSGTDQPAPQRSKSGLARKAGASRPSQSTRPPSGRSA
jgi:hypothetical protein